MNSTVVLIPETETELLRSLVRETGKPEAQIVAEALHLLKDRLTVASGERLAVMRQAWGIWRDRDDLPDFEALRREEDRTARGPVE